MNPIEETILLNNEGARLLVSGNTLPALRILSRAGKVLRSASEEDMTCDSCDNYPRTSVFGSTRPDTEKSCVPSTAVRFFVYTRPLVFPTNIKISTLEELDRVVDTLSLYIVFNLALACHCFGMESGKDAPLRRAKELYHAVLRTPVCATNFTMSQTLIHCIVLNNLSHLHAEWCQYDDSQQCMQCVHDLICQTGCLQAANAVDVASPLTSYEVEEIVLNTVFYQPPTVAHAA